MSYISNQMRVFLFILHTTFKFNSHKKKFYFSTNLQGTLWSCAPVCYGAVPLYVMELCTRMLWSCAPVCYGAVYPYVMELCTHMLWSCAPVCYGALNP
ncbi:hypothetical protein CDAR_597781 [Caerostris darwini]|uniref:Uncharacterized protein n=1 Tax=Caerostris darwini TaxID=1538125 RepID=A0AAV4UEX0_9ARAC|nr:hypothetical protein CDAR_597781 [Caerostris darwini]